MVEIKTNTYKDDRGGVAQMVEDVCKNLHTATQIHMSLRNGEWSMSYLGPNKPRPIQPITDPEPSIA